MSDMYRRLGGSHTATERGVPLEAEPTPVTSPSSIFTLSAAVSSGLGIKNRLADAHGDRGTYQDGHSLLKRRKVRHLCGLLLDVVQSLSIYAVDCLPGGRSGSQLGRSDKEKEKRVVGLDYFCWLCLRRIQLFPAFCPTLPPSCH